MPLPRNIGTGRALLAGGGVAAPAFADTTLAAAQMGVAYSDGVSATGATSYAIASGSLPAGLSLNTSTGAITGTPTSIGVSNFTIDAINAGGTTNSGALSITSTFSDSFTRSNGVIGGSWTGANWTISGNAALCTPTEGATVTANSGFDSDTAWTKGANWSIGSGVATKTQPGYNGLTQNGIMSANAWYRVAFDNAAGTFTGDASSFHTAGSTTWQASTTPYVTGYATGANFTLNGNNAIAGTVDNLNVKPISGMPAQIDFGVVNVLATVKVTRPATQIQAGLMHYSDDSNYVLAVLDQTTGIHRIRLMKRVGGTMTIVSTATVSYSAGAVLELERNSSNQYTVRYGGSTVINATAVNDAVFQTATTWGMFSTDAAVTFDDFTAAAA